MRLDEIFASDPLALVMTLQTPNVRRRVFSQRQDEFAIRKPLVQLAVDRKPRPIVERFILLRLCKHLVDLISFYFHRQVHVVSAMFESEAPKAVPERRRSRFRQTNAHHLRCADWSNTGPGSSESIIDPSQEHGHYS